MVEEQAVVVDVDNEIAMLEVVRRTPCSLCGQTRGCGASLWGKLLRHRPHIFKAANQVNAKVGDYVVVGIEEQALLRGSLLAYGVPLIAMMVGALIAVAFWSANGNRDVSAVIGAVLGLALGLLWVRGHATGHGLDSRYQPVILRVGDRVVIN